MIYAHIPSSQHHVGSISFSLGLSCWPSNLSCELETDNWNLFALKLSRIEKGGRNIGKRTQTYSSFFLWFDFIWNWDWDRSLNLISSLRPHFISFIEDHSRRKEGAEWFQRLILTARYQNNSTHHTSWLQTTSRWRGENFIFYYFIVRDSPKLYFFKKLLKFYCGIELLLYLGGIQ